MFQKSFTAKFQGGLRPPSLPTPMVPLLFFEVLSSIIILFLLIARVAINSDLKMKTLINNVFHQETFNFKYTRTSSVTHFVTCFAKKTLFLSTFFVFDISMHLTVAVFPFLFLFEQRLKSLFHLFNNYITS